MTKNIIFLLIAFIVLMAISSNIRENFSVRRIRRTITRPVQRHISSHIDAFKSKMTNFQKNYL
jgi:hypothetical protein